MSALSSRCAYTRGAGEFVRRRTPRRRNSRASLVALVVSLGAIAACGAANGASPSPSARPAPAVSHGAISVGGVQRTYRLYRLASVDPGKPAPLVVVLHGNGSTGDEMAQTTEFDPVADARGFILVYPNGVRQSWNGGFCCEPAPTLNVDDVGFLNALIEQLEAQFAVNRSRVFLTGFSSGAIMAYRYACEGAVPMRAVAPVAGTMMLTGCHPRHPVSVLAINGTIDGEVPFGGGHLLPGASATDAIVPPVSSVVGLWPSWTSAERECRPTRMGRSP